MVGTLDAVGGSGVDPEYGDVFEAVDGVFGGAAALDDLVVGE